MPHAVLDKKVDLQRLSDEFQEIMEKKPFLIKIQDVFVDRQKRTALLPTIVIDEKNQQFLIEINTREGKSTIRLYPGTDPEKTEGVKTALGLVVRKLQDIFIDTKITKTNIEEYILTKKSVEEYIHK